MEYVKFSAKNVESAVNQAMVELQATSEELEYEVIEKGSTGLFGIGSKPAVIQARKKFTLEGEAANFLSHVLELMNMEVSVEISYDEEEKNMDIDLKGDDMGILIGKRGQTLDSLQYLTSLYINKYTEEYVRVKLDIENYRERRKETLETLAKNIAYKVKRTKRPVSLEPMNPYERRIIHSALQADKYVVTRSEGEEPFRHVVVSLKRERREYNRDYSGWDNNRGYNRSGNRNYGRNYNGEGRREYNSDRNSRYQNRGGYNNRYAQNSENEGDRSNYSNNYNNSYKNNYRNKYEDKSISRYNNRYEPEQNAESSENSEE